MENYNQDIVLIHGLWMTTLSWENWVKRFNDRGFSVLTPTWPGMEGKTVEEIRSAPDFLKGLGIKEILTHLEKVLRQFDKQPMIIGHSFGGIFTQLLLDKGYGQTGVAINSAPLKGVWRLPVTTLRAAWPGIKKPFDVKGLIDFTFDEFNYAFTNGMAMDEAHAAYERYYIPAPRRPVLQAALANITPSPATSINFKNNQRAPLLLIAGGSDNITPASMNEENYRRYRSASKTEFKIFEGRDHYTIGQPGWEKLADYCLDWSLNAGKNKMSSAYTEFRI